MKENVWRRMFSIITMLLAGRAVVSQRNKNISAHSAVWAKCPGWYKRKIKTQIYCSPWEERFYRIICFSVSRKHGGNIFPFDGSNISIHESRSFQYVFSPLKVVFNFYKRYKFSSNFYQTFYDYNIYFNRVNLTMW